LTGLAKDLLNFDLKDAKTLADMAKTAVTGKAVNEISVIHSLTSHSSFGHVRQGFGIFQVKIEQVLSKAPAARLLSSSKLWLLPCGPCPPKLAMAATYKSQPPESRAP
jgi:hypothetical protein